LPRARKLGYHRQDEVDVKYLGLGASNNLAPCKGHGTFPESKAVWAWQVKARPGEELVSVIGPSATPFGKLSQENQAEVELLIAFDDKSAPVALRITLLVERLIVDAIQRQDEGLTKVAPLPSLCEAASRRPIRNEAQSPCGNV